MTQVLVPELELQRLQHSSTSVRNHRPLKIDRLAAALDDQVTGIGSHEIAVVSCTVVLESGALDILREHHFRTFNGCLVVETQRVLPGDLHAGVSEGQRKSSEQGTPCSSRAVTNEGATGEEDQGAFRVVGGAVLVDIFADKEDST